MSDFKKFCIDEKLSSVQIVGARKAWQHQQAKIEKLEIELSTTKQVLGNVIDMEVAKVDNLKAQLNNMEACYIEKKKQVDAAKQLIEDLNKCYQQDRQNKFEYWRGFADSAGTLRKRLEQALTGEE